MTTAGDTVLGIACTRGHIGVLDYLVKDKHCDPDGEVNVCILYTIMPYNVYTSKYALQCVPGAGNDVIHTINLTNPFMIFLLTQGQ